MTAFKCLVIFGIGTCPMLFQLTNDMKNNLETININAKRKNSQSKIVKQFSQFIQFHSKLIQLSIIFFEPIPIKLNQISNFLFRQIHDYSNFLNIIFMIIFSWSIAGICILMLMLNMMVKCFLCSKNRFVNEMTNNKMCLNFYGDRIQPIHWM